MRALVTGSRGTIGQALARRLGELGHEVVAWDRALAPIDRYDTMERFVAASAVDVVYHLAIASRPTGREGESWHVNVHWTGELAWICRTLGLRFVHTSTAMVFSSEARGPFTLATPADAAHGYGYEKRIAEDRALRQYPSSVVVRLGWQIGDAPGGNEMLAALRRRAEEDGEVRASTRWLPACSFLADTADALVRAATAPPGLYMLDANERWTFFEIARALARARGEPWRVVPTEDLVQDQRMLDPRLAVPSLRARLPELG